MGIFSAFVDKRIRAMQTINAETSPRTGSGITEEQLAAMLAGQQQQEPSPQPKPEPFSIIVRWDCDDPKTGGPKEPTRIDNVVGYGLSDGCAFIMYNLEGGFVNFIKAELVASVGVHDPFAGPTNSMPLHYPQGDALASEAKE